MESSLTKREFIIESLGEKVGVEVSSKDTLSTVRELILEELDSDQVPSGDDTTEFGFGFKVNGISLGTKQESKKNAFALLDKEAKVELITRNMKRKVSSLEPSGSSPNSVSNNETTCISDAKRRKLNVSASVTPPTESKLSKGPSKNDTSSPVLSRQNLASSFAKVQSSPALTASKNGNEQRDEAQNEPNTAKNIGSVARNDRGWYADFGNDLPYSFQDNDGPKKKAQQQRFSSTQSYVSMLRKPSRREIIIDLAPSDAESEDESSSTRKKPAQVISKAGKPPSRMQQRRTKGTQRSAESSSDSDSESEDESTRKKSPQASEGKPPRRQNKTNGARRSVPREAMCTVYKWIYDAVEESEEAMRKTPSDAKIHTPTKHHGDDFSLDDSDDTGLGTNESDWYPFADESVNGHCQGQ